MTHADAWEPDWRDGFVSEIAEGDLIDLRGTHLRVMARTHTPVYQPAITVTLPDGSTQGLFKNTPCRIFDPDGSVAARLQEQREGVARP